MNILIADNDDSVHQDVSVQLQKQGHTIFNTYNSGETLYVLTNEKIDLFFLGISLLELEGVETLKYMRSLYCNPDIVLLTSMGDVELAKEGLKKGARSFLLKPLDLEEVNEVIKETKACNDGLLMTHRGIG